MEEDKRRKRPVRDIFKQTYPEFSILLKKFRQIEPENSETHESHIIFFQPFLNYPVKLDDYIKVEPTYWARAFLEMEPYAITCLLCGLLFSEKDLANRHELSIIRKMAIQKAVKWLMCKTQDPWSYDYKTASLPTMVYDANLIHEIDRAFDTFTTFYVNIFDASQIYGFENESQDEPRRSRKICFTLEKVQDNSSVVPIDEEDLFEMINYDDYFKQVLKNQEEGKSTVSLGNPTQIAAHLTKIAITQNTDIFVDAVQFSKMRWAKCLEQAMHNDSIFKIAEILFRRYFWLDFRGKNRPFYSFRDFCPVKRLAIIRATAWIRENYSLGYNIDASIPEQNLFLSAEEIAKIDNAITEKYGELNHYVEGLQLEDQKEIPLESDSFQLELDFSQNPTFGVSSAFPKTSDFCSSELYSINELALAKNSVTSSPSPVVKVQESLISVTFLENNAGVNLEQNGIGYIIPGETWTNAKQTFESTKSKNPEKAEVKAGEVLFDELFSKNEILMGSLSGRNKAVPLCKAKRTAICNTVALLRFLANSGSVQSSDTFSISPLSMMEKECLGQRIFIYYRNIRAKTLREKATV